jgi:hypothetical protein
MQRILQQQKEDVPMKQKLRVKYPLIATLLIAVALCLLGLPYSNVNADPPEPTPTPSPAMDIRTRLQPYQTPGVAPSEPDDRLFQEAPPPSEVEEPPIGALAQQTFYCTADATVLQGYPSRNLGRITDMWAGYDEYLEPDGRIARSLIKCDISNLPSNATITGAKLRVYLVTSWDFPNTSRTITAYRITSNWSESSVTWNNSPGYGSAYGSRSIVSSAWGWYEFDVTGLVRAWHNGTYTNHGIMLRGPEVSGYNASWRGFGTRESPYKPRLVVDYVISPRVYSITPSSGLNTGVIHITNLAGANFRAGATVKLTKVGQSNINATNVVVVSASKITCDLNLTGAASGAWDVVVTNPDGQSGTLVGGFTVTQLIQPPRVDRITPNSGPNTGVIHITNLAGGNFRTGATVKLTKVGQSNINATGVDVVSASKITCNLNLTGAAPGAWTVVVTNPDGQSGRLSAGFTIVEPEDYYTYLPIILNNAGAPPTPIGPPPAPRLNPINNSDRDGNYTVSWSSVTGATGYVLQEDDNGSFTSPSTAYSGANTSKTITGKSAGTYYYRVQATNSSGNSPWSNVVSVQVNPTAGPVDGHWTGTTSRGWPISFNVSSGGTSWSDFKLKTDFSAGGCSGTLETTVFGPGTITNNQFSYSGGTFSFSGQFTSSTTANGTYAFTNHSIPGCGNFSQSGTWTANWP